MRLAYVDPPYIGCAHLYPENQEVDHVELVDRLMAEYDGWVLHAAASNASEEVLAPMMAKLGVRKCVWVKPFAAFKRNVPVGYAHEYAYVKAARKPVVSKRIVPLRDYLAEGITMKRGLTGAKPEAVCHWLFEVVGARPDDELSDLYPGSGAVTRAWKTWQGKFTLPIAAE